MARYIKAEQGLEHSVIYTTDDGKYIRYSHGSWPWRNNNPGNLHPGKVSKRNNQIGIAGKMAVFPDRETGHNALLDDLKNEHGNQSIDQMIHDYAPPKDNIHFPAYKKDLHDKTGVKGKKKIKDFTSEQFENLWKTIEKWEGYDREDPTNKRKMVDVYKISQVRKDKNNYISEYYIEGKGWIKQKDAYDLASQNKLDVEICTSKLGKAYLRARPNSSFQKDFDDIIEKHHEN